MKNYDMAKILGVIVFLAGLVVIIGWIANIPVLKSILPGWVTMKFTTSVCFILTGIMIYFSAEYLEGNKDYAEIVIPVASLVIILVMGLMLLSNVFGIRTGIEDLFVKEATSAVSSSTPGRPSVATMVEFVLIVIAGLNVLLGNENKKIVSGLGIVISIIGAVGVLGYILSIPALYYNVEGFSTSMAAHTALLFVITGGAFYLLASEKGGKK